MPLDECAVAAGTSGKDAVGLSPDFYFSLSLSPSLPPSFPLVGAQPSVNPDSTRAMLHPRFLFAFPFGTFEGPGRFQDDSTCCALYRYLQCFRGGLVFEAHRLLYHLA